LLCEPTSLAPASNKRRADATTTCFPTRVLFRRTHLRVADFSCDINPGTPFMACYKAQTPGGIVRQVSKIDPKDSDILR
jgi:hypothetical protein